MKSKNKEFSIKFWITRKVIENPLKSILFPLAFTSIFGLGMTFIVVDDDMLAMLPNNMSSKLSWDAVQDEFGSTESIFIAFGYKDKTIFNKSSFSDLWKLTNELESRPEIKKITSLSNLPKIENVDGFLEVHSLQPSEELDDIQINGIKKYVYNNQSIRARSISKDGNYFNIMVQPNDSIAHNVVRDIVVEIGDSLLSKNYEIHYGGTAYITGSVPGMIKNDISKLLGVGLVLMSLILLVNIRDLFAVGMIFSVIIQSLIVMAGLMGWVVYLTGSENFYFTIINSSMPIILLTIANSDGVHVVTKFFKEMRHNGNIKKSIAKSIDTLFVPIFLTSVTTIAAFLTLYFAPINQLMGYGICLSAGILYAFILSLTFLPAAMSLKRWDLNSKAISQNGYLENIISKFGKLVISKPKSILVVGMIIMFIGTAGLSLLKVDVNIANFFKEDTDFRKSIDFIDQEMTGTMDVRIRVEAPIKDPNTLNEMQEMQTLLNSNPKVTTSYSIVDVVKQMHRILIDDNPEFEIVPKDEKKVSNLLMMYSISGDQDDLNTIVDYNYKVGLITALSRVMSTEEIIQFVKKIEDQVYDFKHISNASITGMAIVIRDLIYLVIESSVISIFSSVILICLITSIFFKNFSWGFLSIVPLVTAVLINFGFMGIAGIHLSHVTALLSSVIIGVGVDFSIHYIYQYRRLINDKVRNGISNKVINEVGYPIVLDAASNMSFGALLFSTFIPVQYVGGLMVFAMFSTAFGTLTLLAASVELLKTSYSK
ncbi:MMPL family transporter [Candidatus Marinimicrobia bacterium]|nr:MMPL family transporter [Candidatus Neomarinimicrobiota bacterium]